MSRIKLQPVALFVCFCFFPFSAALLLTPLFLSNLPQKVSGQKQEIDNLLQKRTSVKEEEALMKEELRTLQEHLTRKSQELEVGRLLFSAGFLILKSLFLYDIHHKKPPEAKTSGIWII